MRNLSIDELDFVAGGSDCGCGGGSLISTGDILSNNANGNTVAVANGNSVNANGNASGNNVNTAVTSDVTAKVHDILQGCLSLL
jgi:hypothetical protein